MFSATKICREGGSKPSQNKQKLAYERLSNMTSRYRARVVFQMPKMTAHPMTNDHTLTTGLICGGCEKRNREDFSGSMGEGKWIRVGGSGTAHPAIRRGYFEGLARASSTPLHSGQSQIWFTAHLSGTFP